MLKEILRKAVTSLKGATVVLAVTALAVGGASSAQRVFEAYATPVEAADAVSDVAQLLPGPPSPDEVPQNMTPSGKPNCEPYAYLSALLMVDFANSDSRSESDDVSFVALPWTNQFSTRRASVLSTAFEVSSQLGIQFTLVGAKPSGTS